MLGLGPIELIAIGIIVLGIAAALIGLSRRPK
jgi:hypothetical protein